MSTEAKQNSTHEEPLTLEGIVEPVCRAHGVELVSVRQYQQRGGTVLQVMIDREAPRAEGSGVTLEHCTNVSRALSTALDAHEDLVAGKYNLEVSSPGLERPLVKLRDFERFAGREAKVQTRQPVMERRRFQGTLLGVQENLVRLEQDGVPVEIPFEDISKAHLVYSF